jgi:hypothetical protein
MEPPVLAALVTGIAGVLLATGKILWDQREKSQERRRSARAELNRYREPLLSAVDELGNRIDNIRNKNYLRYYLKTERRQTALRTTSFRIAQYFAWTEILYGDSGQYRFAADKETHAVNANLGWVAATFTNDDLDQEKSGQAASSRLMLWREEQRGIGELMRKPGSSPACVGYSTFVKNYDNHYSEWFKRFEAELESMFLPTEPKPDSQRLTLLQGVLAELLVNLDIDKAVVTLKEGKVEKPEWAQPCRYPEPEQYRKDLKAAAMLSRVLP